MKGKQELPRYEEAEVYFRKCKKKKKKKKPHESG